MFFSPKFRNFCYGRPLSLFAPGVKHKSRSCVDMFSTSGRRVHGQPSKRLPFHFLFFSRCNKWYFRLRMNGAVPVRHPHVFISCTGTLPILTYLPYLLTFTHTLTHSLTHLLTPCSRVLLEKLTGFAANQEIPRNLWNPKVHCRTHKRLSRDFTNIFFLSLNFKTKMI